METDLRTAFGAFNRGDHVAAENLYRSVLSQAPEHAIAHRLYALLLDATGRGGEAATRCRIALVLIPGLAEAWTQYGAVCVRLERFVDAIPSLIRARSIDVRDIEARLNLAIAAAKLERPSPGLAALREAVALSPQDPGLHVQEGNLRLVVGDADAAWTAYRRALAIDGRLVNAQSGVLGALVYRDVRNPEDRATAYREWAARSRPSSIPPAPAVADRSPDRRLSIGYLSADFKNHPLGRTMAVAVERHDRSQVKILAYAQSSVVDDVSSRIAASADIWRSSISLDDRALADVIRADGIDILVHLAGHTEANRISVAWLRPAPIQVSFGDLATSGLPTMDYWITDDKLHPQEPGATREWFSEELWRIPNQYFIPPPDAAPAIGPPPVLRRGHVTFGCFNNPVKITERVAAVWSEVLRRVPGSTLLFKYRQRYEDPATVARVAGLFSRNGISADRLKVATGGLGRHDHLTVVGDVDIALDPFPFNGCTATFESLWMGVPVVILTGDTFLSRTGLSLLAETGVVDLSAVDEGSYVEACVALAADAGRLAAMRSGLRDQVRRSRICDAPAFVRSLEIAYRGMWRRHLAAA